MRNRMARTDGGYDDGYRTAPCFWGSQPGRLVQQLTSQLQGWSGLKVLDLGCGEGKNAMFIARLGAIVEAYDISPFAIANAKRAWPDHTAVNWTVQDVRAMSFAQGKYDVVIAYGLLHCLDNSEEVAALLRRLQLACRANGFHVICAFNSRRQDLRAHPGFEPVLLSHEDYLSFYDGWHVLCASDEDLHEEHPHNRIPHTHSLTRILARKPTS